MIDFAKFYTIASSDGFSVADIPIALRDSIAYTFADYDRQGDLRYESGGEWVQGFQQMLHFASTDESPATDNAFCITVSDTVRTKLGLVMFASDDAFASYHEYLESEGVRDAVARAFGYDDVIIINYGLPHREVRAYPTGATGTNWRVGRPVPVYYAGYTTDVNWMAVDEGSEPAVTSVMGEIFPGDNPAKRSPLIMYKEQNTIRYAIPLEHYQTDAENVATLNTSCDALLAARVAALDASIAAQIETLTSAFASVAELAGTLSVFGNTVKDVATRYNNVSQYIPRP